MRLWIDVREACRERKTGKGNWTHRCVTALLERSDLQVTLLTDADVPPSWTKAPGFRAVRTIDASGYWWHLKAWRLILLERRSIDCYFSPTSFIVPYLLARRVRVVPVVHDLIAFRDEPHDRKARMIERMTLPRVLKTAAAVCSVSEATAALVTKEFSTTSPITAVLAGPTTDETNTWEGGGDHILCIGTLCPRKNQLRLIKAFAALPDALRHNHHLVLVGGRGWSDDDIVEAAQSTPGVTWTGYRSDAECKDLLRTCAAFAYVSQEEGFGLPVLDALCVGAPVLSSDIPTAREVASDAVTYVDPLDVSSIAEGLETVLKHGDAKREKGLLQATKFAWPDVAERVVRACGGVDNRR